MKDILVLLGDGVVAGIMASVLLILSSVTGMTHTEIIIFVLVILVIRLERLCSDD